jgi:cardiolipin synthase A/B
MPENTAQSPNTTQPKRKFTLSTRLKIVVLDCLAVKLIIQPRDGATPILTAIKKAKKSVDIAIFRFDRTDIEAELKAAAARGVKVTALIAYVNRGGEKHLRALEMRFLEAGIIIARTSDDLVRYHDKLIIFDRKTLFMLSFNFTHLDIDHSRGFGIITSNTKIVQEAIKLFEADRTRKSYSAGLETFVVSPVNSRKVLTAFLKRAKKQLLIYDPEISDPEVGRILRNGPRKALKLESLEERPSDWAYK